ncbi:MAG: hypothetical protein R3343_05585 [Nitriliruptorales bacterium]|nr:hypothetical protein [Nitriliruptorales bacterium]
MIPSEFEELRARVAAGEVIDGRGVQASDLARLVAVASTAGSPLLPALDATAGAIADRAEIADSVRIATAQARAVAAGLVLVPVVLVPGLGGLLDLDLLGFYRSGPGMIVLVIAGGLLVGGVAAIAALIRRSRRLAEPPRDGSATEDEVVDLVATAVAGAVPAGHACGLVATRAPAHQPVLHRLSLALQFDRTVDVPAPFDRVLVTLERSGRLGAPAEPALRRLAAAIRAERRTGALESAQRLPALLTFPTALCLLPASILLVGAPLVASGLEAVTGV